MLRPIHIVFVCRKIKHPPRHETGPDRVGHFKRPKTYAFFPKRIFRLATGASLAKKNGKNGFNLKKIRMKVRNVKLLPATDASLSGFRSKICENVRKCVIFYALTENPTVACRKSCRNDETWNFFRSKFLPATDASLAGLTLQISPNNFRKTTEEGANFPQERLRAKRTLPLHSGPVFNLVVKSTVVARGCYKEPLIGECFFGKA